MRALTFPIAAATTAVLMAACGGTTTPPTPKPTTIVLDKTSSSLDAVGATVQLTATVKDQNGNAMAGQTITWASDNAASATVSGTGLVTAVKNGTAHVSATSGSLSAQATVTVAQVPTQITKVSGDAQNGTVGTVLAQPFVVQVKDRLAQPVDGAVVTFAIAAGGGSLSATKDTTDASGQASATWTLGTAAGAGQVSAGLSGGASATFDATLLADVADSLAKKSGDNQSGVPSAALADSVVVRVADQYGNPVSGTAVTFTVTGGGGSVSPSSASSGSDGLAAAQWTMGSSEGANTLDAASSGLTGSPVTFHATATNLTITSVTPDTISEGGSATITGTGFDATAANNTVTVDGVAATVNTASATQLTITVPTYDCKPARNVNVQVTVGAANSNTVSHAEKPASYVNLSVGQQTIVQDPSQFCFQFAPNVAGTDQYLVGVGAATESPTTLNSITLSSTAGLGPVAPVMTAPTVSAMTRTGAAEQQQLSPLQREVAERWARQYASEPMIRASGAAALQRAARMGAIPRAAPRIAGAPQSPQTVPNVGDTVTYHVPVGPNFCSNSVLIGAVVKAVGSAGIWVSDTANPKVSDSLTDAEIQAYSDTFDTKIFATDTGYFGAPSDIDNNQRIVIILTVNVDTIAGGNLAGFVYAGDLTDPSSGGCASSDKGEIFYGDVPNPNDPTPSYRRTHSGVTFQMPSLIAHEFTHDIQDSRRYILDGSVTGLAAWEAEGQAVFAQNAVGDDVLGNMSGQNYGWSTAHTGQGQRWYGQGFDLLTDYFGFDDAAYRSSGGSTRQKVANAPQQCSLYADAFTAGVNGPCFDFAFYGAAYSFEKYITDRYGPAYAGSVGGEKGLQHDVIDANPTLKGRANWAALLGLSSAGFDSVFSQWSAMLYVDDRVSGISTALQMASWNLNGTATGIFGPGGYNDSTRYLVPTQQAWGAFSLAKSVRDGSNFYTLLSSTGAHSALAVKARDGSGNPLGTGMKPQFWIVRIQ